MRTAVCFTLLLFFTSLSAIAGVHASPPTEGSTVLISADETWNGTHAMNGNVVIENGAELTINGDVTIATGNAITVQENSTLSLSGSLIGEELDSGIAIMNNTQLHLNFGDLAESGQLRVDFDQTIPNSAMFNMTVGEETIDAVGSDHIFIDVSLNGTDLLADFYVYYAFEIQIVSIQALHSGSGESPLLLANEINQTNGSLKWNSASFELEVFGTLLLNGCLLYTSPSPRDATLSRMPSSA